MSMQQQEAWLARRNCGRAGQVVYRAPAGEKADKGGVKLKGPRLAQWLCNGKLMALAGGDRVTFGDQTQEECKRTSRRISLRARRRVAGSLPHLRGAEQPGDSPHLAAAAGCQQAAVKSGSVKDRGPGLFFHHRLLLVQG